MRRPFLTFGASLLVVAALSGAAGLLAGRRMQSQRGGLGDLQRAPAETPALSSTGSCQFDLRGDKVETVFFLLGLLNEYSGRHILDDDHIERFYCNESQTAALFRRYLRKLAQEQSLDSGSIREEIEQGCLMSFRSCPIAERLNSCYRRATAGGAARGTDGTYHRIWRASLGLTLFTRSGRVETKPGVGRVDENFYRRRALAYVSGAWVRWGRNGDFVFANAQDKVHLIAELLSWLGCTKVRIESDVGFIPRTNWVHFQPSAEVMRSFEREW
jgi:hypothetical protein